MVALIISLIPHTELLEIICSFYILPAMLRHSYSFWDASRGFVKLIDGQSDEQDGQGLIATIPFAFLEAIHARALYLRDLVTMLIENAHEFTLQLDGEVVCNNELIVSNKSYTVHCQDGALRKSKITDVPRYQDSDDILNLNTVEVSLKKRNVAISSCYIGRILRSSFPPRPGMRCNRKAARHI